MKTEDEYYKIAYKIVDEQEWAECEYSLEKYLYFKKTQIDNKLEVKNAN